MEDEIKNFLLLNKIEFYQQYNSFEFLNGKSLDFYLKDRNIAIECQGEQHFIGIDYFGGENNLKSQQKRDIEKFNKCKENNIKLLYYVNPKLIKFTYRDEIVNKYIPNYFQKIFTDLKDLKNEILKN